jgi:hypothetical protein
LIADFGLKVGTSRMDDSSASNYLPIFQIPSKESFVSLGTDNQWGLEHEGRFLSFTTPSNCMPLLPMLESPYSEVVELIHAKLHEAGKDEHLIETFPFDLLIQSALTWETSYWPLLAVQWLEAGYPVSDESAIHLKPAAEDNHCSQNLRHRAKHLIERHAT